MMYKEFDYLYRDLYFYEHKIFYENISQYNTSSNESEFKKKQSLQCC